MLLAAGPEPLLKMVEDGYRIEQITVGNLSGKPGYQHVKKTLYLSDADVENFKRLADQGVKLKVQMVPDDVPEDLAEIVRKL